MFSSSDERTPAPFEVPFLDEIGEQTGLSGRVLVVDDDADIREAVRGVLEEAGYSVVLASDGQRAYEYLAENPPPDCVVLDLWMPVMDGWSLASEVLLGRLPTVPILVITAANANFAYPVPPRYVLRKPFNPDRMLMLVAELVETRPTGPVE
jgi:two-component system chemotaxis response regulator CheY